MSAIPRFITAVPRHYRKQFIKWLLIDAVIILVAYSAVFSVRNLTLTPGYYMAQGYFVVFTTGVILTMLYVFGVYYHIWLQTSGHGITIILNAMLSATLIIVVVDAMITPRPLPLSVILLGNALAVGGITSARYRSQLTAGLMQWWIMRPYGRQKCTRVLIFGAGEAGQILAWRLKYRTSQQSHDVVGFIDDNPDKRGLYVEGCPVLGDRHQLQHIVETHYIDLIVIAIQNIGGPDFREILSLCEATSARIKVVPDLTDFVNARHNTTLLRDVRPEDLIGRSALSRDSNAVNLAHVTHKTILVTGAAGSIGSELCRQIPLHKPKQMIMLDSNESGLHDLVTAVKTRFPDVDLVPVLADITVRDSLQAVFEQFPIQVVFHAAAYKHVPMLETCPHEALRVNVGGTRNVAELARDCGVKRFVLISTDKAVNPSSVMGASKRVCELIVKALAAEQRHTLFTAVRFGNVLGSRGSVVPTFNRQIDHGGPVTVTHPDMRRYFMSIPEAVNLVIHAACLTTGGDTFVLKMGDEVRIVELAERMIRLRGLRPYQDIPIRFTGIRPGEKMNEGLFSESEYVVKTAHPHIIKIVSQEPMTPALFYHG